MSRRAAGAAAERWFRTVLTCARRILFGECGRGIRGRRAAVWCMQRLLLSVLMAILAFGALSTVIVGAGHPRTPLVVGFGVLLGLLNAVFLRAHRGVDQLGRPRVRAIARASVTAQVWAYLGGGAALITLRLLAPDLDPATPVISAGIGGATFGALALAVRATEALAHARLDDDEPDRIGRAARARRRRPSRTIRG